MHAIGAELADSMAFNHCLLYTSDAAGRAWITTITTQAQRAGMSFHMKVEAGGLRSVRRWEILRGLVALADGYDNDDAIRGCLVHAIGAELADSMAFNHGQLVGRMGATEAATFANVAVSLAAGEVSMAFIDTGRARVAA